MPYQLHEFLIVLFNLSAPLWGIWVSMVFGAMVNRLTGVSIALIWGLQLVGSIWYQFVGQVGSARYLISRLDRADGPPGYTPELPRWWLPWSVVWFECLLIFALVLIPVALYVIDARKFDGYSAWDELKAYFWPLVGLLGRIILGYGFALLAIVTGVLGAGVAGVLGLILGLPVGFVVGIAAGVDFDTAVFACVYIGAAIGFVVAGGGFILTMLADVTAKTAARMNQVHRDRVASRIRTEDLMSQAMQQMSDIQDEHASRMDKINYQKRRAVE